MHKAWDICLTVAAFVFAYYIKKYYLPAPFRGLSTDPNYYILLLLCIIIWYLVFKFSGLYKPFGKQSFPSIAVSVVKAVSICLLILAVILFFLKLYIISRLFIGIFIVLNLFFLMLSKWAIYKILVHIWKKGYNLKNVVIVGCGAKALEIAKCIDRLPEVGYQVLGCLTADPDDTACRSGLLKIIGNISDIQNILAHNVVDELIFADPLRKIPNIDKYIYEAENMGIMVHILPEWGLRQIGFIPRVGKLQFENVFGMPTLSLINTPTGEKFFIKNVIDRAVSGIGLAICIIPFLLFAILIKLSSSGPVFFKQQRVGLNGRRFTLYKFRTMFDDAETNKSKLLAFNESDGPVFKIRKDPRVVPCIGTFLRKTSLDELPQLINVFMGDMSLVGPRPPLPDEIKEYDIGQRRRLSMKPGITCIWQTSCNRNDISFKDWVKMDLEYIDNWSLGLDFRILLKTVWVVLTGEGR